MTLASRFALIIPAAGASTRFGTNKLLAMLAGETVISRTLSAFANHERLARVVIAAAHSNALRQACEKVIAKIEARGIAVDFCIGGACRAESVHHAVNAVPEDIEWVAVHDAARPLVSADLIERILIAAVEKGAAVPALAMPLTIKEAIGPLPARVIRTLPRARLWAMQTPQVMRRKRLLRAYAGCPIPLSEVTDDLQLLELAGDEAWLIAGEERNLKLTTSNDLAVAEALLRQI